MGELLKFVTPDKGLRKKRKKFFAFFCKNNSILRLFEVYFGLKYPFYAAQNVHKISIKRTGGRKLNY